MTDQLPEYTATSRLGIMMIVIGLVLMFGLFTLLFQQKIDEQNNPNQRVKIVTTGDQAHIVLKHNRSGHYVVNGLINGHEVTFLVDTGATSVAMPASVAKRVGVTLGESYMSHTAAGDAKSFYTELAEVSIGPIKIMNLEGAVIPSMRGEEVLLGMSFLKYLDLRQKNGELIIQVP